MGLVPVKKERVNTHMGLLNLYAQRTDSEAEVCLVSPLALNEIISPLGRLCMYASSLVFLYDAWRALSWLFGPYVENERV